MSFPEQQPGEATEPIWGKEARSHPMDTSLSCGGGSLESTACSQLREEQGDEPEKPERERPSSPVSSVMSMMSDRSQGEPLNFKEQEKVTEVSAGRVLCDVCPNPAVKTCLTCGDSYCMTCITPHYSDPDLERHQLQDIQDQSLCQQHHKQLEFYCRTDQSAICSHCLLKDHKGHDVVEQNPHETQCKVTETGGVPPPGQIQFASVQPDCVTLRWSPPEGVPGPYRFRVTRRQGHKQHSITVAGSEVVVTGLLPASKYHFTVVTLSEDGRQSPCVDGSVHTDVPMPENLTVETNSLCVSLKWTKPEGIDLVSYLLELQGQGQLLKSIHTCLPLYSISDLQHGNKYTVQVSTVKNDLQSKPASKSFTTGIPAPENLTASSITSSSASLSWLVCPEIKQTPHSFLVSYLSEGTEQKSIPTKSCSTVITGLKPGTDYAVNVYTELQHGRKSKPVSVQMTTDSVMGQEPSALYKLQSYTISRPQAPQLQDISVKRGQAITFRWDANCEVYGTWKKDGLTLHNDDRIIITETKKLCFNLTIHNATEEDEGEYTLELSNWRSQVSDSAKVKILDYAVTWRKLDQRNDPEKTALREFTPGNIEAQRLRFLLHGPVGAGKSSIINSINTVLQGRIKEDVYVAPSTGKSETTRYQMYEIKDQQGKLLSLVFNDIMGLESTEKSGVLTADIISALKGHIKDDYEFNQLSPLSGGMYYNYNPTLDAKVHCLVSVISANRIFLLEETSGIIMKMNEVRDVAKNLGIPHVVLMTHVDSCCPLVNEDLDKIYFSKKIKRAMENCSVKLGVSINRIFPVKNYHEENSVDKKMDGLILDALHAIVDYGNNYVIKQIK